MPLIHVIYASAATRPFTPDELDRLLAGARRHNESLSVTGMLLHVDGSFFQVLEGEPEVVCPLYETIERDPRHKKVTCIINEPILERSFGAWTMGYLAPSAAELADIEGRNDFFGRAQSFSGLDNGRAKKLLAAFREGRWRQRLAGAEVATS